MEKQIKFVSKVDVYVKGLSLFLGVDATVDYNQHKGDVHWLLEPEYRSWGLKSIDIAVTEVNTNIDWFVYKEDLSEEEVHKLLAGGAEDNNNLIYGTIPVTALYNSDKWSIIDDIEILVGGFCCPTEVEINLNNHTLTIN